MSGLCGIVRFDGRGVDGGDIRAMIQAAPWRATKGQRAVTRDDLCLVELGAYPAGDIGQGPIAVACHARIDNRAGVGAALGLTDDADDRQLVAAAYRRWGTDFLDRLIGDVAVAVWDGRARCLVLARDPLAIRPLYFHHDRHTVTLASEVSQIAARPGFRRTVDEVAVASYLAARTPPGGRTFYQGVRTVEPGEVVTISANGISSARPWGPRFEPPGNGQDHVVDLFQELLTDAVRCRRSVASRPGLMLSGGLDSSLIAAADHAGREPGMAALRAYTWALPGRDDERPRSRLVAQAMGLELTEVPVDGPLPLAGYPDHGPHHDDPFTWPYQPLIDRTLEYAASDEVDLLMTGDRGDETVGDWIFDDLGLLGSGRVLAVFADLLARRRSTGRPLVEIVMNQIVRPALRPHRRTPSPSEPPPWMSPDLRSLLEPVEFAVPGRVQGPRRARYERIVQGPGSQIALAAERSFARLGLAYAEPWSDRRITEFVVSLPQWRVQTRSRPKALAAQVLARIGAGSPDPPRTKIEPTTSFAEGLSSAESTVRDLLCGSEAQARGYFSAASVRAGYEAFLAGRPPEADFWRPLTLEMWLRHHW